MSKSKEELDALKKEVESVNEKCHELTPEELDLVTGGIDFKLLRTLMGIIFEPPSSMTGGKTVSQ